MIRWNGKDPIRMVFGGKDIEFIVAKSQEIWTAVRSCFGKGYWVDDAVWVDEDVWAD